MDDHGWLHVITWNKIHTMSTSKRWIFHRIFTLDDGSPHASLPCQVAATKATWLFFFLGVVGEGLNCEASCAMTQNLGVYITQTWEFCRVKPSALFSVLDLSFASWKSTKGFNGLWFIIISIETNSQKIQHQTCNIIRWMWLEGLSPDPHINVRWKHIGEIENSGQLISLLGGSRWC